MLVFLLLAILAAVTALPIDVPSSPLVCPDRERWYSCGACDATCAEQYVACAAICRKGSCGCILGHVREPKEHRCVPRNECPKIDLAELRPIPADLRPVPADLHPVPADLRPVPADLRPVPDQLHPGLADLRPVPDEIRPVGPIIVQAPICPDKEMYFHCGACDRSCGGVQPNCPKLCQEQGSCGCIAGHVREARGPRCIPETECNSGVGPAEIHPPLPAVIRPIAQEIVPPYPVGIRPQLCPDREMWFPCGACDRTCGGVLPNCPKLCQEQGSCGCIAGHVREARGPRCIPDAFECNFGVGPAEIHPPVPAELRPVVDEIVPPYPIGIRPQLCPDREMWFPCGACDGSCSEPSPVCHKMCQSKGSCGCVDNHVREPKGHGCIHVMNCPNTFIPLEIHG